MGQQILQEVNLLKQFLKSLGLSKAKKEPVKKAKAKSNLASEVSDFVVNVLKSLKISYTQSSVQSNAEGVSIRYTIAIGGKKYLLKAYAVEASGQFNLILWSRDQQELLDAISVGNILTQKYRLRAVAKERLKGWAEK
jgi:hypothetical protein